EGAGRQLPGSARCVVRHRGRRRPEAGCQGRRRRWQRHSRGDRTQRYGRSGCGKSNRRAGGPTPARSGRRAMARIVLTLPRPRIGPFAEIPREHGHEALELPFLALEPLVGASDGDSLRARLADCDWVVFVSPTAVEVVADAIDARWPTGPAVAIVGPGSLAALASRGATAGRRVLMPTGPVFDAAALLA